MSGTKNSSVKTGVLQGDTLAAFLFVITLDYALRTSLDKHNDLGFTLSERLSSRYPAKKLTDIDYADDLVITANTISNATTYINLKMLLKMLDCTCMSMLLRQNT